VTRDLLDVYDHQLREEAELGHSADVRRDGPVWLAVFGHGGFVTYRDLAGLEGADLDALIGRVVAHFRDETDVRAFEWKTRGHDAPADLPERLAAHGLVAEPQETVMLGEAAALAVPVELPAGVVVRRAGAGSGVIPTEMSRLERSNLHRSIGSTALRDDIAAILRLQWGIFGPGRGPSLEAALAAIERDGDEHWLAEVAGEVVSAGRLSVVPGTEVAGLWGGVTAPAWRGRGIYRALVAARAASAVEQGVRFLHSDCTEMSRPILERSGLVAVTTTTPYVWTR
jgi:N-acetylglutamate synthase-like GNAT family acetyltransferase